MSRSNFERLLRHLEQQKPQPGHMGPISRTKMFLDVQATQSVEDSSADGGFSFVGDRSIEVYLDPVDPKGTRDRYRGDSGEGGPAYLTLLARAEGDELKGQSLRTEFLPFSMNWELSADYKRPSSTSNAKKAEVLDAALDDPEGVGSFVDGLTVELFESKPSSKARKYLFARLQFALHRHDDVFSGYKAFGTTARRREQRLREALWGICPAGIESRVEHMVKTSERLSTLRKLAESGKLGLAFRTPYLDPLTGESLAALDTCLLAACYKAFAGPRDLATGPGEQGWVGEPVSRLAGWYFMEILREFNRRSLKRAEKGEQSGHQELVEGKEDATQRKLTGKERDALALLAQDQAYSMIDSEQPLAADDLVASLDSSDPGMVALSLKIVDAILQHPEGDPYVQQLRKARLAPALEAQVQEGEVDNRDLSQRLLERLTNGN